MKFALFIAVSMFLEGCSSVPPFLERWAGLEMDQLALECVDPKITESFYFFVEPDRMVLVKVTPGGYIPGPAVSWRIREGWLEIDTSNDGTFQKRMRPVAVKKDRISVEDPTGKRRVYQYSRSHWLPTSA